MFKKEQNSTQKNAKCRQSFKTPHTPRDEKIDIEDKNSKKVIINLMFTIYTIYNKIFKRRDLEIGD